ncbi:MAG TPA: NADH-dependent flavin oxidoreductase [Candidatus Merdenecus merdavium]|nr:NADH-dependent flavin oxidoreductase [Candidatus Merdenecus merdavium]
MENKLTDRVVFRNGGVVGNRIAMAPMQTHSGAKGGFVTEDTINYYSARSKAAGLLITEFHYVSEHGGPCYVPGYPEQLGIYSDEHLAGAKKITQELKKDGNKAILQIHHGGRMAVGRYLNGKDVVAPSSLFRNYPVRELTEEEIEEIIKDFGRATRRAIEAGFDGVEIHGANHYLLQQFFSVLTNRREDKWGGTLEKRMAFPLAVVSEVKRVVAEYAPKGFIVGYRISPEEIHGSDIGYTYRESTRLIAEVVKQELDYIHLSLWDGYASTPGDTDKSYAELYKEVLDEKTKLVIVGGIFNEEDARNAIEQYADIIAIGRGTLLDPQFAKKVEDGKGNTILNKISPDILDYVQWTLGLKEVFSRDDSLGLPSLPGRESIGHLHTGCFDERK